MCHGRHSRWWSSCTWLNQHRLKLPCLKLRYKKKNKCWNFSSPTLTCTAQSLVCGRPQTAGLITFSTAEDERSCPAAASGNGSQSVHVRICEFVGGRQAKSMRCNKKRFFLFSKRSFLVPASAKWITETNSNRGRVWPPLGEQTFYSGLRQQVKFAFGKKYFISDADVWHSWGEKKRH